jgi:cytochrome c oxidase subunit II
MNPGVHDVLAAWGAQAGHVASLWNIYMVMCLVWFVAVLAAVLLAIRRAPDLSEPELADLSTINVPEPRLRRNVSTAVGITIVGLITLLVASVFTDRAIARLPLKDAINIEVTGHQWWWTVRYDVGPVHETFETANEIHIPVGRPVVVQLHADDVIHSLWIPSLTGKRDLIPGRTAVLAFQADQPGIYRGQCAEFCGFQHAFMALDVQAETPEQFETWRKGQLAPAPEPTDPQAQRGKQLVQSIQCAMCHTIQGTIAQGKLGPDLTHLASRRTLAAGTLPNDAGNLASWIADPQKHKPGVNMPANPMSGDDLAAIVAYLGTLK